jgi:hypothetical protein
MTRNFGATTDRRKAERSLYLGNDLSDQLHVPVALPSREEFPVPLEYAVGWALKQVWTKWKGNKFLPLIGIELRFPARSFCSWIIVTKFNNNNNNNNNNVQCWVSWPLLITNCTVFGYSTEDAARIVNSFSFTISLTRNYNNSQLLPKLLRVYTFTIFIL